MASKHIEVLDTTLRDGAQGERISFSISDKEAIARRLDAAGICYIEAGNPGSNPKDAALFERLYKKPLKNSTLVAFGATRRPGSACTDDAQLVTLAECSADVASIFGKCWDLHVADVLKTSAEENLSMIRDSISFLRSHGKRVFFDAEHFFDGYKSDREYALAVCNAAMAAGAERLILCDTNGGTLPHEIYNISADMARRFPGVVGIHCHDDTGLSAASTIEAVRAGAIQVQGTMNGYGERCGNANLTVILPTIRFKLGMHCLSDEAFLAWPETARFVSEIANLQLGMRTPYVGRSAFAHKGGMHIDGILKNPHSFEHIQPELVGNHRRLLLSEVSGRAMLNTRVHRLCPDIDKDSPELINIMEALKRMEYNGYQYESAEASFDMLVLRMLGRHKPAFELKDFKIISSRENETQAIVKVSVKDREEITAAEGEGPVNALDAALRKALMVFYPELSAMKLHDFKVRVVDMAGTASIVRVHIDSTDGKHVWGTVGVSRNIIEASLSALIDSIEYMLGYIKDEA